MVRRSWGAGLCRLGAGVEISFWRDRKPLENFEQGSGVICLMFPNNHFSNYGKRVGKVEAGGPGDRLCTVILMFIFTVFKSNIGAVKGKQKLRRRKFEINLLYSTSNSRVSTPWFIKYLNFKNFWLKVGKWEKEKQKAYGITWHCIEKLIHRHHSLSVF